jgi:hypothetical protein
VRSFQDAYAFFDRIKMNNPDRTIKPEPTIMFVLRVSPNRNTPSKMPNNSRV